MTFDAVVIGGGPAGATTGLILARAGWSVAIVEKASFPRRKVCGEFISATSLPLLHDIGVARSFLDCAGPDVRRVALFAAESIASSAMPHQTDGAWGRALGREHLDLLLLDAAVRAGAKLWQPFAAMELQQRGDATVCTIAANRTPIQLRGRLVVLAHGSWERGPRTVAPQAHAAGDLLAFKAHFTGSDLPSDLLPLLVFPGGYGGMVHSDAGRVSLSCCIRRDELAQCRRRYPGHGAGEAVLLHIQTSCLGVRDALRRATLHGAWLSAGPIRPGIRRVYQDGLFLAGNLAGEAHPIVAEGIGMAMQSAWLLSQILVAHQDDVLAGHTHAELGRAYAAAWNRSFGRRVRAAAAFAYLALRPRIGRRLLPIIERFPQVLTFGAQLSGKTTQVVAAT